MDPLTVVRNLEELQSHSSLKQLLERAIDPRLWQVMEKIWETYGKPQPSWIERLFGASKPDFAHYVEIFRYSDDTEVDVVAHWVAHRPELGLYEFWLRLNIFHRGGRTPDKIFHELTTWIRINGGTIQKTLQTHDFEAVLKLLGTPYS